MSVTIPGVLVRIDPVGTAVPVVFDSPHSGRAYPEDFGTVAPRQVLRTAEDAFVEELYGEAPRFGAVLVHALFPRSYIDPNRSVADIDQSLLAEPWPGPLSPTRKTELGLSLIRRLAAPGQPMYDRRLSAAEVQARIDKYYRPYHGELASALDHLHARFGGVWHVDCHSMKAKGNDMSPDSGALRPDFVVSDRQGATSGGEFLELVVETLRGLGYSVAVNDPYLGAELIARYGRPAENRHSLQIEVNRRLYMDETGVEKTAGFSALRAELTQLVERVCLYARDRSG